MQYKCEVCHDSGSKNQTGDYLDCPACDMPMIRKSLNDFVKSLGPTHPEDVALAIHQRALAMAPKQELEPSLLWDAEDPEDGTHASSAADFARNHAEAAMSKGDVLDVSVLTAVHSRTRTMRIKVKDVDDGEWLEWEWLDGAAPAAANGAMPDFCFEDDADFMYRLGLLMNTKWPEMRKDGLARKISELANAHIRAALSGAKGNA